MSSKQLLIFDSGVGGLSIFQEIIQHSGNINCYYLSDNAYFPYGELTENVLISRLTDLLSQFVKQQPVDMIVIACNSASTVALASLREHFSIPVVGVVPAIKPASLATKNGVIGLVATPATIHRNYTAQLINEFAADKQVLNIGSTALVKVAEQKLQGNLVDIGVIEAVFQPWLMLEILPDTIVLGCTHFPLLRSEIDSCFEGKVKLVDSGSAIAKRVNQLLGDDVGQDKAQYDAFYTLQDDNQLQLKHAFLTMGFSSFSLFE